MADTFKKYPKLAEQIAIDVWEIKIEVAIVIISNSSTKDLLKHQAFYYYILLRPLKINNILDTLYQ